jgi:hypothetical protein
MLCSYFVMVDMFFQPYQCTMHLENEQALHDLESLGFKGLDVYLAELIPAVEMAWADGEIQKDERALLDVYGESLTDYLNRQAGAPFFRLGRTRAQLERLLRRRLTPGERRVALRALKSWSAATRGGEEMRKRMLAWAEAVGGITGSPLWDVRELFWLHTMKGEH